MSTSPDLTLKIKLDDRDLDSAIKKLQNSVKQIEIQLGGKVGGGGGATGTGAEEKSQRSKAGNYMEQTLKGFKEMGDKLKSISKSSLALAGIGTGIGAMVAMMIEASPMLQAMLKLISTSVMLILRPIGDFIGFILRPILMLFMTKIALPFMLTMMPLAKKYGDKIGQFLVNFLQNPGAALTKLWDYGLPFLGAMLSDIMGKLLPTGIPGLILGILQGMVTDLIINPAIAAWEAISKFFNDILIEPLQEAWDDFVQFFVDVGASIDGVLVTIGEAWDGLVTWFTDLDTAIKGGLTDAWNALVLFFDTISATVTGTLSEAWRQLTNWANAVYSGVTGTLFKALNILINWWAAIQSGVGVLTQAWQSFTQFFSNIASDASGWVTERWNAVTQFFSNVASDAGGWVAERWKEITALFTDILNALKSIWDKIQALIQSLFKGSGGGGGGGGGQQTSPWDPDRSKTSHNQLGGIINEPVIGLGLNSGRSYTFGESGPEMITPIGAGAKPMKGGGINLTVTVGSIMNQADMDALIAKMMAALQREQSRRGLV